VNGPLDRPPDSAAAAAGGELVEQLRDALGRASELAASLSSALASARREFEPEPERPPAGDLGAQLAAARVDVEELSGRLVETEHQLDWLMNLYVAAYQLHSFLEPPLVISTIAEIAINLLGAERFALLLRKDGAEACEVSLGEGIDAESAPLYAAELYPGGDALVDATLADGVLRFGPVDGSSTLAVVPLKIQDQVVGALAILKLLPHKPRLRPEDRDLLDLLSAHAASALFAARLFAAKDRKLRTLESLVRLARRE
jgi:GAF domain-containing protein